ncbi:MAG TPA: type I 3-dehydroquinate dehydratase, partial [Tepidanaerobacteraceae bacterium]|nr:type I 3-dehydroquinate dehydratase [Tepidanaerobacteraceae bacterium]
ACDPEKVLLALRLIRSIIGEIPIIFTFRSSLEGGNMEVDDDIRYEIIEKAINTKKVDVIDIELISGKTNIRRIKAATVKQNIPLILSYHNFKETPSVEFMLDKMKEQVLNGADIAKIAVMPKDEEDVLNLLSATLKARKEMPGTPLITMSMDELGVITRIAGGVFGSDLTFGACGKNSAPGQISVVELREAMKTVYGGSIYNSASFTSTDYAVPDY